MAWRRERLEQLLAGPYGEPARLLLSFLKTKPSAKALLAHIDAGPWRGADADVRHEILALVDATLVKWRLAEGKAPFDDPLPGQPHNVFLALLERLFPISADAAAPPGAQPGLGPNITIKELSE